MKADIPVSESESETSSESEQEEMMPVRVLPKPVFVSKYISFNLEILVLLLSKETHWQFVQRMQRKTGN